MSLHKLIDDPVLFIAYVWPQLRLYDKQAEILYSLRDNDETVVPAGNMLGKDFIAAYGVLWFFSTRTPCRVITTSAGGGQLKNVLWGEIRRALNTATRPLPLIVNDLSIKQRFNGQINGLSYLIGRVTKKEESLQGHHVARGPDGRPRTLALFDESSGIETKFYHATDTWAHRKLIIGNPLPCENFFKEGVEAGDVEDPTKPGRYYRKVIRIRGIDSPNVRLALKEKEAGLPVSHRELIPGVLSYAEYCKRRLMWDPVRQCIGLDANFYKGAELLMFPPHWLNAAEEAADTPIFRKLRARKRGTAIGIDTAEGGDNTVWTVVNPLGILYQESIKTGDTSVISGRTIALGKEYKVPSSMWIFDRGGGGKEHSDALNAKGYDTQTIGFGERASQRYTYQVSRARRIADAEAAYAYKNKRAEMYNLLRLMIKPADNKTFAIPSEYTELRRQLAALPILYDEEGRLYMLPKRKKPGSRQRCLIDILGCSPDEGDSAALAVHGLVRGDLRPVAGSLI